MAILPKDVQNLWLQYNTTKSEETKNRIITEYIPLVKYIVNRINVKLPSYLDVEDLFSFGLFGLIQAIERFDINKNVKFETYAYARIKGSIIDELRKLDWVPQNVRKKIKEVIQAYDELEQDTNKTVTDAEIAQKLNISIEELHILYQEMAFSNIVSFEQEFSINNIKSNRMLPETQVEKKEVKQLLGKAIDKLPPQEKLVITLYYYEGLTFKEIAKVLDLSLSRISQLHTKAILRLRGSLSRKRSYL